MTKAQTQVDVEILAYVENAISDHFDDGGFAVYDGTEMAIVENGKNTERRLWIYHDVPAPGDSQWRAVGKRFRMLLPSDLLVSDSQIFSGAVIDIRPL